VNGQAAGAGFALALACDARVAARAARLNFAYGQHRLSADGGMSWFLPRIVGPARSLELILEQPVIRPEQARREGLVSDVVDTGDVVEHSVRLGRVLAQRNPGEVASARRLVRHSERSSLEDQLGLETALFVESLRRGR
jgi:enoyl-CoA hydratase/carnithine racemase